MSKLFIFWLLSATSVGLGLGLIVQDKSRSFSNREECARVYELEIPWQEGFDNPSGRK